MLPPQQNQSRAGLGRLLTGAGASGGRAVGHGRGRSFGRLLQSARNTQASTPKGPASEVESALGADPGKRGVDMVAPQCSASRERR